ncbi:MAG: lipase [Bacteroidales bacterium]|nr:lipase [Bacteroidales bacterium]
MKIQTFLFSALFIICSCGQAQQNKTAETATSSSTYIIEECLPVRKESDMKWITRYSDQIEALEGKAAADSISDIDVMFFGSSSIRLWKGLEEMMSPLRVVNRGYGGATIRDIHYNYPILMAQYKPKAFVVFCDNDIAGNANDLTTGEVLDHYRLLFQRLDKDYPGTPVFFLSWKYSELRAGLRDKQRIVNHLIEEYADKSEQVTFVDVNSLLLDKDGNVNSSLFEKDNLHINRDGYLLWTSVLKPKLMEICCQE